MFFCFKQKTAYEMRISDWSSDVCSSDLEAVTKYLLAQYVRTRESWIPAAAEENFRFVTILSQPAEQQRWARFFSNNNAASPQNAWGKNAVVQARVRNIAFINDRVANVRFTRIVQTEADTQSSDWIATVTFAYANAPMRSE